MRTALAVASVAPLTSLLTSRLLAAAVGAAGLDGRLPVGVHTYLPGVDLVDIQRLETAALLFALPGIFGVARGIADRLEPGTRATSRDVLRVGCLLVLAQVLLYLGQALVVAGTQGLPDAAPAVLLAVVLPALLTLAAAAAVSVAGVLVALPTGTIAVPAPVAGIVVRRWLAPPARRGTGVPHAPLRGPPPPPTTVRG